MDTSELKEMIEPDELAEFLDLDYQYKGSNCLVLCPFHGDRTLGSAYLKDGHFHCFSCGESMDYITLTQRVLNISFKEAVKELSALVGIAYSSHYNDSDNGYYKVKLSAEEMKVINIPQSNINLRKIYTASPENYTKIVKSLANKNLKRYEMILKKYSKRSSSKALDIYKLYDGKVNAKVYSNIENEALSRIRTCQDILERFE